MKITRCVLIIAYVVMAIWPHQTYPLHVLRYGMIQGFIGGGMVTLGFMSNPKKRY